MYNWKKYNQAIIPDCPPHFRVTDSIDTIRNILKDSGMYFARWTSDFDCQVETKFWYVINDKKLDITDYSKNTRSKIRRGLKRCKVILVEKTEIKKHGFECYIQAFRSYRTHMLPKNIQDFTKEIDMLDETWHFWGIYNSDGKMIGYSQNKVFNDYCDYSTIKFHPEYLKLYPSFALFYTMNQYYLNENNFQYVNDGSRSISHDTNIQAFLMSKFKFRKAYCKLHIIYSKPVKILVKILFPFSRVFRYFDYGPLVKINILLYQESIRRSYEKRD